MTNTTKAQEKFRCLAPRNFEEYLGYVFMNEVPEDAGDKDTFEENFAEWITQQTPDHIIELAEKWGLKTF